MEFFSTPFFTTHHDIQTTTLHMETDSYRKDKLFLFSHCGLNTGRTPYNSTVLIQAMFARRVHEKQDLAT